MEVIITAKNNKGLKAINKIGQEKDKRMEIKGNDLIIKIPPHIAPFIRLIKNKMGITPQYDDFIKKIMKDNGASESDYSYKVV